MTVTVKICGIRSLRDAEMCVAAGADAIGLNFVPSSPRVIDRPLAKEIVRAVGQRTLVVGVVANMPESEIRSLIEETGVACIQFHGDEPPESLSAFLPHAYKAIRVRTAGDVATADAFPGNYILVDAFSPNALGGTGTTFAWELVVPLAMRRKLSLAGGLTPENVADAVRQVNPFCVDVASGVESSPGEKDEARVRAFIANAKG